VAEELGVQRNKREMWRVRRVYVWAAWASLFVGIVISIIFWLWLGYHEGRRGERLPGVLLFYLILLFTSVVAGLAGIFSLFGVRSRQDALLIIPASLLGVGINGYNAFMCYLAYALEGMNLGG
jgi:hypothetical protein